MKKNIVLFPKLIEEMEIEIDHYMETEQYEDALEKLYALLEHDYHSYKLHVQTMTCFITLHKYTEAALFCEELLHDRKQTHYYDYLDYYLMILFEGEQYGELIRVIEQEAVLGAPQEMSIKMRELKRLAEQMEGWERQSLFQSFTAAVECNDPKQQYILLQKWQQRKYSVQEEMYSLLDDETIHPIIKTVLFLILQQMGISTAVTIEKFQQKITVSPSEIARMEELANYKKCLACIEQLEQDNPTLYLLAKELLDQYCYVLYPFIFKEEEAVIIADKFITIAKTNLAFISPPKNLDKGTKHILTCHQFYQEIVEQ